MLLGLASKTYQLSLGEKLKLQSQAELLKNHPQTKHPETFLVSAKR